VYISGYRSGDLSGFQAARILGYDSRFEFEEFLKLRGIYEHAYTASDLAEDLNFEQSQVAPWTRITVGSMIVVADASPLNYLIQIQFDTLLHVLFGQVLVPTAVIEELAIPAHPILLRPGSRGALHGSTYGPSLRQTTMPLRHSIQANVKRLYWLNKRMLTFS